MTHNDEVYYAAPIVARDGGEEIWRGLHDGERMPGSVTETVRPAEREAGWAAAAPRL